MLPTFSLNLSVFNADIVDKVNTLLKDGISEEDSEFVSNAYFSIVQGTLNGAVNLRRYSQKAKKLSSYKDNDRAKKVLFFINEAELKAGHQGILDIEKSDGEEVFDECAKKVDFDVDTHSFLMIRDRLFYQQGIDIWYLMKVASTGDPVAGRKLREVVKRNGLSDLVYSVLTSQLVFSKLQEVLR